MTVCECSRTINIQRVVVNPLGRVVNPSNLQGFCQAIRHKQRCPSKVIRKIYGKIDSIKEIKDHLIVL